MAAAAVSVSPAPPSASVVDATGMLPEEAFEIVVKINDPTRWVVFELGSDKKSLKVVASGTDFEGFKAQFRPEKVLWGAFNVHGVDERNSVESVRTKVVQVNWVGAAVKPMQRMKAMQGASLASQVIAGAVATCIDANSVDDIDPKDIAVKLANCGGAHKPTYYGFDSSMKISLKDIGKDVAGDDF